MYKIKVYSFEKEYVQCQTSWSTFH